MLQIGVQEQEIIIRFSLLEWSGDTINNNNDSLTKHKI